MADALGSAHRHDVIHRDIKPENILLEEGHAVVADFGIARAIHAAGGERLTETGLAVGTPAYMSPEQAMGSKDLDGRSDLYSLGCVLYEMLGGEPPYAGPSAQAILARKLVEPLPRLRVVREAVPETVETAVCKALAKSPADRFRAATDFAAALTAEAAPAPVVRDERSIAVLPASRGWGEVGPPGGLVGGWGAGGLEGFPRHGVLGRCDCRRTTAEGVGANRVDCLLRLGC